MPVNWNVFGGNNNAGQPTGGTATPFRPAASTGSNPYTGLFPFQLGPTTTPPSPPISGLAPVNTTANNSTGIWAKIMELLKSPGGASLIGGGIGALGAGISANADSQQSAAQLAEQQRQFDLQQAQQRQLAGAQMQGSSPYQFTRENSQFDLADALANRAQNFQLPTQLQNFAPAMAPAGSLDAYRASITPAKRAAGATPYWTEAAKLGAATPDLAAILGATAGDPANASIAKSRQSWYDSQAGQQKSNNSAMSAALGLSGSTLPQTLAQRGNFTQPAQGSSVAKSLAGLGLNVGTQVATGVATNWLTKFLSGLGKKG